MTSHFCFGFRECPAWERWLFIVWAGDGGIDGEVLFYPQRVTSADYQMLNTCDSSQLASFRVEMPALDRSTHRGGNS